MAVADRQHPKQRLLQARGERGRGWTGSRLEDHLQRKQREVKPACSSPLHPGQHGSQLSGRPHRTLRPPTGHQRGGSAQVPISTSRGAFPPHCAVFCPSPSVLLMSCWQCACGKLSTYSLKRQVGPRGRLTSAHVPSGDGGSCLCDGFSELGSLTCKMLYSAFKSQHRVVSGFKKAPSQQL